MEQRITKVSIGAAGGTAAKGSKTYKITLPTAWMKKMGIDESHRELELTFDGERILLSRRFSGSDFAARQRALGHVVRILRFYDKDTLCSVIYADFTEQRIVVENQEVPLVKTAFGNTPLPTWGDFQRFLEDRCIPRQRAGIQKYLQALGLEEYAPLAIIEKTGGRMAEDQQWLSIEVMK